MNIFVSCPFSDDFRAVFGVIDDAARRRGFQGYRVDQELCATSPIADAIARRIRDSRVVIADITGNNPNVLNEIGQAQVLGKPLILISQDRPTGGSFQCPGTHDPSLLAARPPGPRRTYRPSACGRYIAQ